MRRQERDAVAVGRPRRVDDYNKMMYNYKAVVQLEDLTHERQLQERQEKLHTTTVIDTDKSKQLV